MKIGLYIEKRAALKAGRDEHGWKVLEIPAADLAEAEREALLAHPHRGTEPEGADYCLGSNYPATYELAQADGIEDLREGLRQIAAAEAAQAAEAEAREAERAERWRAELERYLQDPSARWPGDAYVPAPVAELWRRANALHLQREAEEQAAREARTAEAEAKKARAEAEKSAQLTEIVARLGNDNQRARHAEGLLPAREGWELLEREELARFSGLEHVEHQGDLTSGPSCGDGYCEGCNREACGIEKLAAEEFETWTQIQKLLPAGARHEFRRETATCTCEGASTRRTYARVTWIVGAYQMRRDFPLGPETETETEETED